MVLAYYHLFWVSVDCLLLKNNCRMKYFWCRKNNWCLIFSYEMSFTQTRNPFIGELWPFFSSYFKYVAIVSFLFSFRLCLCPLVLVWSYFRPKDGKYMSLIGLKTRERNLSIEYYNSFNTCSSQQKLLGQTSAWFCLAKARNRYSNFDKSK